MKPECKTRQSTRLFGRFKSITKRDFSVGAKALVCVTPLTWLIPGGIHWGDQALRPSVVG